VYWSVLCVIAQKSTFARISATQSGRHLQFSVHREDLGGEFLAISPAGNEIPSPRSFFQGRPTAEFVECFGPVASGFRTPAGLRPGRGDKRIRLLGLLALP